MFAIKISDSNNPSASTAATRSPSPELEYIEPGNLPAPVAMELQRDADEDTPFIASPSFSPTFPAEIQVKTEIFSTNTEDARWARLTTLAEVAREAAKEAAFEAGERIKAEIQTEAAKLQALDAADVVRNHLDKLAYLKSLKQVPSQNPIDDWGTESSGWTGSDSWDDCINWPTPPRTPPQGDDMHPPAAGHCGEKPEGDWLVNTLGNHTYYRFLIPDPSVQHRSIVAPYVKFRLEQGHPEVFATYGQGYKVHTRLLQATPVEYFSPMLTPHQLEVIDPTASFSKGVERVIQHHLPVDLVASIRQYQYYRNTRHSIKKVADELRIKEAKYLNREEEVAEILEDANLLGRILAHADTLAQELGDDLGAHFQFSRITQGFKGKIPYSAQDVKGEQVRRVLSPCRKDDNRPLWQQETDDYQTHKAKKFAADPRTLKRCHRCHQLGHIRRICNKSVPNNERRKEHRRIPRK